MPQVPQFFLPSSLLNRTIEALAPNAQQFIHDFPRIFKLRVKVNDVWEDFDNRQIAAQAIFLRKIANKNPYFANLIEEQLHQAGIFSSGRIVLERISLLPFGIALVNNERKSVQFDIEVEEDWLTVTEILAYDELQFRPIDDFAREVEFVENKLYTEGKADIWKLKNLSMDCKRNLQGLRECILRAYCSSPDLEFHDCDGISIKENGLGERSLVFDEKMILKITHRAEWNSLQGQARLLPLREADTELIGKGAIEKLFVNDLSDVSQWNQRADTHRLTGIENIFSSSSYQFNNLQLADKLQKDIEECLLRFFHSLRLMMAALANSFSYVAEVLVSEKVRSTWTCS